VLFLLFKILFVLP